MTILWPKLEERCVAYLKQCIHDYFRDYPEKRSMFETVEEINNVADQDGRMFVTVMRELLLGNSTKPGMGIPFVVSFTTHKDEYARHHGMLSQWRGYGGTDNVAIVFDPKELERLLKLEESRFVYLSCLIADAIYFREDMDLVGQFSILFSEMKNFALDMVNGWNDYFIILFSEMKNFALDMVNGWNDYDESHHSRLETLSSALLPAVSRLKHWAFHEENECRIILGVTDEHYRGQFEEHGHRGAEFKKVVFRSGSEGPIPYIPLFEGLGEMLPITRILIGPSKNQHKKFRRVHKILNQIECGGKIKIQCSDIPFFQY